jgi:RNA polymerase sigma factor (TIGR02999 family)
METSAVTPSRQDVTRLLNELAGQQDVLPQLIPLVYDELRHLAAAYLRRERAGHTLEPTALVNEAYLKLVDQKSVHWHDRAHFLSIAAQLMRRILVDHARARHATKRGGDQQAVPLDDAIPAALPRLEDVVTVDELLTRLASMDPQQARVVELRVFGGLTIEETADVIGISPATVKRDWNLAKAWLHREIRDQTSR